MFHHIMPPADSQKSRAVELLHAKGMVRLREFMAVGIAPETLARLVRDEVVIRLSRGLYQLADAPLEAAHALAAASALVPKGVVCLTSALQFHELTLQMPSTIWMAIERAAWRPTFANPRVRFVRYSSEALASGIKRHRIDGVDVPLTEPARTIVDCFRFRSKVGLDVAMEGLREGLRQRLCTPDDLFCIAKPMRIWPVMRPYVESMVADGA